MERKTRLRHLKGVFDEKEIKVRLADVAEIPAICTLAHQGKLKHLINPVRGFKSMKTAYATIKGFSLMLMFKKRTAAHVEVGPRSHRRNPAH